MSDADVRNLVAVRVLHEYFGVTVEVAMDRRASGGELSALLTVEYDKRHGKAHDKAGGTNARGSKPGKSDKGKKQGKGH